MYTGNPDVPDDVFSDVLKQISEFVRTEVMPRELEIMATDAIPDDLRTQAAEMGLFGYAIPQEWGGLGLNLAQDVELAMELGYTSLALRSMFGTNNGIAGQVLVGFGTDEQKARWLRGHRLRRRRRLVRADRARRRIQPVGPATKADARRRRLDDQRQQAVHHQRPDRRPVRRLRPHRARPTTTAPASRCSWCPPTPHGVEVGAKDAKMGQEGRWTADVTFTDVRVADARRWSAASEDIGYRAAMTSLARGRVHIAALAVGSRAARARRVGRLRRHRHPGRHPDRRLPAGAGDDRRPADRRAGRPGTGPRRRTQVGRRHRRTAGSRRRRRSCSAPKWPARCRSRGPGPRRHRLHARGAGRAHLPRRPAAAPLRGHQRDPAADHRRRTGAAGAAEFVMTLPLEGMTVVAIEQAVAAPLATRNLADLGARVIKVERVDGGDLARGYDHVVARHRSAFRLAQPRQGIAGRRPQERAGSRHRPAADRRCADVFLQNLAPGCRRTARFWRRRTPFAPDAN